LKLSQIALEADTFKDSKIYYDKLMVSFNNFARVVREEVPQKDKKYVNQLLDIVESNLNNFLV